MADKKVSELSAITNLSGDDLLLVVNDPSGTPTSNKVTVSNLFANVVPNVVHKGTVTARGNTTFSGTTMTVSANATFSGTTSFSGGFTFSDVQKFSNTVILNGSTIANSGLTVAQGNFNVTGDSDINVDGTVVIGKNGKLHANNTITAGTITASMIDPTHRNAYMQVANTTSLVNDRIQVANVVNYYVTNTTYQALLSNTIFDQVYNLQFQLDNDAVPGAGVMRWNRAEGTLDLGMTGSDAVLQIGQEMYYYANNNTASTILNGQAVYRTGSDGTRLTVAPLEANGQYEEAFLGLATTDITTEVDSYVTNFGFVRGVDTRGNVANNVTVGDESWSAGDDLYVHPTEEGLLTKVRPRDAIKVGTIINASANGTIFCNPIIYPHFDLIHNVTVNEAANNQVLRYNNANSTWFSSDQVRIVSDFATSNATTEGVVAGEIYASNTYLYVVTSNTTIKRVTLESF